MRQRRSLRRTCAAFLAVSTMFLTLAFGAQPSPALTQTERFVTRVYADVLLRQPTSNELLWWTTVINNGSPRSTFVNDLVYSEGFGDLVAFAVYNLYVGHNPNSTQRSAAQDDIDSGDMLGLESGLLATTEYWTASGSTNTGYVQNLYQDVLRRAADAPGLAYWVGQLNTAAKTRLQVARSFIAMSESASIRVGGLSSVTTCAATELTSLDALYSGAYCIFLDRIADSGGRTYWAGQLQASGNNLLNLFVSLMSSGEYYANS
ncbi:MAG TPA: DUF4214 domain-containing protein [Iamia sp.]|nr:DUF4214 domain-containing protein [Iamia sp.]